MPIFLFYSNLYHCQLCQHIHPIRRCHRFLRMSTHQRISTVKRYGYCFNCLALSHHIAECTSPERCQECGDAHHTKLHLGIKRTPTYIHRPRSDRNRIHHRRTECFRQPSRHWRDISSPHHAEHFRQSTRDRRGILNCRRQSSKHFLVATPCTTQPNERTIRHFAEVVQALTEL